MSVGGRLIEILPMRLPDSGTDVLRLWVVAKNAGGPGVHDEICVYAEPQENLPKLGDEVWWQGRRIYFDGDRQHLVRIGYSFPAPVAVEQDRGGSSAA
ncbi:hypothetical protein [Methylobacterium sp. Leaf361]|uniref:hypothetical protein n=1 Tax=Methylobacterium sp. Leaf361 TaxID=1736352 RepID=UPI000AE3E36B|nr:hypothetical protein [Methylobacterium sp. Leaf361]